MFLMFFRMIFYTILFYIAFKIVRVIGNFFSTGSQINKTPDTGNGNKKKVYSKDEIEEAEYEEIK